MLLDGGLTLHRGLEQVLIVADLMGIQVLLVLHMEFLSMVNLSLPLAWINDLVALKVLSTLNTGRGLGIWFAIVEGLLLGLVGLVQLVALGRVIHEEDRCRNRFSGCVLQPIDSFGGSLCACLILVASFLGL